MKVSDKIDHVFGLINYHKDNGERWTTSKNKSNEALETNKNKTQSHNNYKWNDPAHIPILHHNANITKHIKRMSFAQDTMFYDHFLDNLKENEAKNINKNATNSNSKHVSKRDVNIINHNDMVKANKIVQIPSLKIEKSCNTNNNNNNNIKSINSGKNASKEGSAITLVKVSPWKKTKTNNNHHSSYSSAYHNISSNHQSKYKEKSKQRCNSDEADNNIFYIKNRILEKTKKRPSLLRVETCNLIQRIVNFQIINTKEIKGTLWNKQGVHINKFNFLQVQRVEWSEKAKIRFGNNECSYHSSNNGISTNNINSIQEYKIPWKERSKSQIFCCF